ncbi:hydroxymethylglutaryl-CoA lyase [Hyphococcus flavus]|uniref:hydroxymethylglutaryl-CoA lyase n=1 Tax=Hyphococcus flavus TaxID=1866326 RepID=A0AAF0CG43_9PROT|nr:hydroxymethylglutaryl-CoA lyase [Hyphococcus flavus]WDI30297.1 hydroxymethylglutaryl-CoA lyase [Hyphococcus flavus]
MTQTISLVEVGPRDGLQNEKQTIDVATKVALIERLADAGMKSVEGGAFVSPKWVPQMAASDEVMQKIKRAPGVSYPVLTPNRQGYEGARAAKADTVAVFGAASESFSQKNINCSIEESFERFKPIIEAAKADGVRVRGYVSCVLGCPYEGAISPSQVLPVARTLYDLGCYEISLGDTIGAGTPKETKALIKLLAQELPISALAGHFHDTYGQALSNIWAAIDEGVTTFDCSVSGLGGCPYAKGASGNVASEDVVYSLERSGLKTGVNLDKLIETSLWISEQLGRKPGSKVTLARSA